MRDDLGRMVNAVLRDPPGPPTAVVPRLHVTLAYLWFRERSHPEQEG